MSDNHLGASHDDPAAGAASRQLLDQALAVGSADDLARFISALAQDFVSHKNAEWENWTVDKYLDATAAWLADNLNVGGLNDLMRSDQPSWQLLAMAFHGGKIYE